MTERPPSRGGGRTTVMLVPAGQAIGPMAGAGAGGEGPAPVVRLGADFHPLSPEEYRLWLHAIGAGDLTELKRRAEADGLTEGVDEAVTALSEIGLLVRVDPDGDHQDVFSRHVLVAQGIGQGVVDDPETFVVAGPDSEPLVGLDAAVYAVWTLSCQATLSATCELAAQRLGLSAGDVGRAVAEDLVTLVGAGAAILDLAPEDGA